MEESRAGSLEERPGVLLVGAPGVGKRTILSRLVAAEVPDTYDLSSGVLCQGWKIDTKYYSADLSIWTAHLEEGFSLGSLPHLDQLAALVMVFDMNDESSLLTLQNWVDSIDIQRFEVLLCIGNKADLVPGHGAHVEYRRRMQRIGESSTDPHPEYLDFGINESEGCGLLLSEDAPRIEIRDSTLQWCIEQNIEYIEACASNADFDKCLSVDGDSQGVERLLGALSAHMWPGMILKSGNKITAPSLAEKESTDDESNYEFEYEVLSHESDEQWEFIGESSTSRSLEGLNEAKAMQDNTHQEVVNAKVDSLVSNPLSNDSSTESAEEKRVTQNHKIEDSGHVDNTEADEDQRTDAQEVNKLFDDEHYGLDDLERLMSEIGNMRSNLRLVPDFQRREMAAKIAMKMATMFGDSDDEGFQAI
ncbi:uncharacterized protein LOC100844433 [Brachypodium distachyon]|uniref:Uncharacterized protein n=1 Tax=Brachypodium distachyon TaxID=15368 RepID=I1J0Z4_BRADI|nr:uncharacterized protein LOC100844433 [Brachypodium distachyon]KQJ84220.1 hypothetical protein BRADI_5g19450v3 [Brachypodium distachyon]|eukprot:XP_003580398.1 uncharacterized protein LOC100844433 [Brachypodium distachyon]